MMYAIYRCIVLLIFHLLLQTERLYGQSQYVNPLQIGDTIPESVWNTNLKVINHTHSKSEISLDEYRHKKLIILDFWATWCGSCIDAVPKMKKLQEEFSGQMQVIFVNSKSSGDTKAKIDTFLARREQYTGLEMDFSSVILDTTLSRLFPYRFIPHYVWLMDGVVERITSSKEVTAENIKATIEKKRIDSYVKNDILNFDSNTPLFSFIHDEVVHNRLLQSTFSEYIEGIGTLRKKNIDEDGKVWKYIILNTPLIEILRTGFREEFQNVPPNRLILEVDNPEIFASKSSTYNNLFCYEIITRPIHMDEILDNLRGDLIRCFKIKIAKEIRNSEVLILKKINDSGKLLTKGGESGWRIDEKSKIKYIRNQPVSTLINVLDISSEIPIVDETGMSNFIDVDLPEKLYDMSVEQLNNYFIRYGLKLERGWQNIEFTIIYDAKK